MTETWYNENNHDLYGMDEYQMVDDYRESQRGGGIVFISTIHLYIKNEMIWMYLMTI